jgi:hypothetical protein
MAVSKSHDKKSPSQNPTSFYKSDQQGGAYGSPTKVGDTLSGGPMLEKIYGRSNLSKPMRGNSLKSK